jgi:hypothetical protein
MNDITNQAQNFPASGDYTTNQSLVNQARGQASEFLGQPYNVYRITSGSNGDVIQSSNLIFTGYPVRKLKASGKDMPRVETDVNPGLMVFALLADMSNIMTGDIFVLNDNVYGPGQTAVEFATQQFNAFGIATTYTQLGKGLGGRLDRNIQVFRPNNLPDSDGYLDETLNDGLPLQCVSGVFTLGAVGATACQIPSGFMSAPRRLRGAVTPNLSNMPPRVVFSIYVPPLNGYHFRRGDILCVQGTQDRYRVLEAFFEDEGFVGTFINAEQVLSTI